MSENEFGIPKEDVNKAMFTMLMSIYQEIRATQAYLLTELCGTNRDKITIALDNLESFRQLAHKESHEHLKNMFGEFPDFDELIKSS